MVPPKKQSSDGTTTSSSTLSSTSSGGALEKTKYVFMEGRKLVVERLFEMILYVVKFSRWINFMYFAN